MTVERNGNGTDYNLVLKTAGGKPGQYDFSLSATRGDETHNVLLETRYGMDEAPQTRSLLIRRRDLEEALGPGWETAKISAQAQLRYAVTHHNRHVAAYLPAAKTASELTRSVRFADLPPWTPARIE